MAMHNLKSGVHKISTIGVEIITKDTSSLYGSDIKTLIFHIISTGHSCNCLTSAAIMGVQVEEISKRC
jgi:hypothetical protein